MNKKPFNLREALKSQGAEIDEKQGKFIDAFSDALEARAKEEKEEYNVSMTEALRSTLGEMPKDDEGKVETIAAQIRTIAEALDKVEKRTVKTFDKAERFQLRKMITDNKEKIISAIRSGVDFELKFEALRAAAPSTNANTMTDAGTFVAPDVENYVVQSEIALIRYPENFILGVIRNVQVSLVPETRIIVEQDTPEGAVAVVAEGGTKPLTQDTFVRTTTARKKYAGRIEWSEEFEMDNNRLFNAILKMFEDKVIRAWNAGIISQIITNATSYTTSVLDGTLVKPDNGIACIASASVINGMNFNATTTVMHPSDIVALMYTQDTDGNWRLVPYLQNGQIGGMNLIGSNTIAQGKALIGDSSTYYEEHSELIVRFGHYNTQFITNEKTAIGEVFSLLSIAAIDEPSWMYIDLEAVKTSLEIVTP